MKTLIALFVVVMVTACADPDPSLDSPPVIIASPVLPEGCTALAAGCSDGVCPYAESTPHSDGFSWCSSIPVFCTSEQITGTAKNFSAEHGYCFDISPFDSATNSKPFEGLFGYCCER